MAKKDKSKEKKGFFQRAKRYFIGVRNELRKVVWPSPKELKNYTLIVIGVSLTVAVVTGIFDSLLSQAFLSWL